jgi:general secretion pathway protein C
VFADVKIDLSRPIAPKLICGILALLLIWQIVAGVGAFFSLDKATLVRHDQLIDNKIKVKQPSLNAGLNTAFFGDYVPKNLSDSDVKQSMLNLTVVGIMFADNSEETSHVIIRSAGGREQTFGIGDSLPGGAIIKRITSDGVLIGRNGSLERLSLQKNALTFEPPAKPLRNSK